MDKRFLGTGMKFPPQIDPATGRFATSSEEESIRESVYLILMTQQSERLVRPEFGSGLLAYTFMDMNSGTFAMLSRELTEALSENEPRITNVRINLEPDDRLGRLLIDIHYTVRATHISDNLVFPFYLNAAEEEEEMEPEYYEPEIVEEVSN
ncbi:MAG: GPW/gp25 family protein [Lachnospiraceae bacterium]|nr:GPW/gp25 family protein [Lachnospiraceae bacterium]